MVLNLRRVTFEGSPPLLENGDQSSRAGSVCRLKAHFCLKMVKPGQTASQLQAGETATAGCCGSLPVPRKGCDNQDPQGDGSTKGSRYHWRRNLEDPGSDEEGVGSGGVSSP
ncbi:unnamed protein product [Rangifer tarandus platyrhynchus]|uniref:Uncharacterized protein n=1 Tax=Rangifer tarandus platyrhynchus TaxID=3082113 RepID=A0AC59Z6Y6_RANTA